MEVQEFQQSRKKHLKLQRDCN